MNVGRVTNVCVVRATTCRNSSSRRVHPLLHLRHRPASSPTVLRARFPSLLNRKRRRREKITRARARARNAFFPQCLFYLARRSPFNLLSDDARASTLRLGPVAVPPALARKTSRATRPDSPVIVFWAVVAPQRRRVA